MLVILDWKTLEAVLVEEPHPTGVMVDGLPQRVRTTDPAHKPAHLTFDPRSQHDVVVSLGESAAMLIQVTF